MNLPDAMPPFARDVAEQVYVLKSRAASAHPGRTIEAVMHPDTLLPLARWALPDRSADELADIVGVDADPGPRAMKVWGIVVVTNRGMAPGHIHFRWVNEAV